MKFSPDNFLFYRVSGTSLPNQLYPHKHIHDWHILCQNCCNPWFDYGMICFFLDNFYLSSRRSHSSSSHGPLKLKVLLLCQSNYPLSFLPTLLPDDDTRYQFHSGPFLLLDIYSKDTTCVDHQSLPAHLETRIWWTRQDRRLPIVDCRLGRQIAAALTC